MFTIIGPRLRLATVNRNFCICRTIRDITAVSFSLLCMHMRSLTSRSLTSSFSSARLLSSSSSSCEPASYRRSLNLMRSLDFSSQATSEFFLSYCCWAARVCRKLFLTCALLSAKRKVSKNCPRASGVPHIGKKSFR